jgi:hypothetical protein
MVEKRDGSVQQARFGTADARAIRSQLARQRTLNPNSKKIEPMIAPWFTGSNWA